MLQCQSNDWFLYECNIDLVWVNEKFADLLQHMGFELLKVNLESDS